VHHVGILYDQFMMHGQRNIKLKNKTFTATTPKKSRHSALPNSSKG